MIKISRSELPEKCPSCGAKLQSYHSAKPMVTRRVCSEKCNGFHVVAEIHHSDGWCFIDRIENKKPLLDIIRRVEKTN